MSRQHPWREQHPDAVRVDRATKWGNPFDVNEHGRASAIAQYRTALLAGELPGIGKQPGVTVTDVRRELAMRTLACWCPPDAACHADVLAAIAVGEDGPPRRGRAPVELPTNLQERLNRYTDQLGKASMLAAHTRRTYTSQVRGYLAWLDGADVWDTGGPLTDEAARDGAVRDYRAHLQTVAQRKPATINAALAAVGDFYTRTGLGVPSVARLDLPQRAPRALDARDTKRWLRTVERWPATRDQVTALLPFYAGLRLGEMVALNVEDAQLSARKGVIVVRSGKGGRYREIPVHAQLREPLHRWITQERQGWLGAEGPALLLNYRGERLSTRGAHNILTTIAEQACIDDFTAHVLRHTFGTRLVRDGHDLVLVAELMGHARVETTRGYSLPTDVDRQTAIDSLPTDR
ncbi:tyrosine-type recombinase/integrase [Micromonospora sp. DT41]|uniref:tyrosine-type recombinase/integrase n=1 Tax=Micromonospora sp. DT41 TaxID=3393437 RepID=UPI003CF7E097